uniref:Transposase Tc1-like domain-containing protein n=1 Tax=Oryzias latipes TaxID=8090 RepID=A0A3B3HJE9_ORYLA
MPQRSSLRKRHRNKPPNFWTKVIWSDETKIDRFGHDQKPQRGSLMVWGDVIALFSSEAVHATPIHNTNPPFHWFHQNKAMVLEWPSKSPDLKRAVQGKYLLCSISNFS